MSCLSVRAPFLEAIEPMKTQEPTMLTNTERATSLKIVISSHDPEEFGAVNDRLCRQFPTITTEDLVSLWREAGERKMAEADELEAWGQQRRTK